MPQREGAMLHKAYRLTNKSLKNAVRWETLSSQKLITTYKQSKKNGERNEVS